MIFALLSSAGLWALAYGFVADSDLALLGGFLAILIALGLHEIPLRRTVRSASVDLAEVPRHPDPDLIDLDTVAWDWDHEEAA